MRTPFQYALIFAITGLSAFSTFGQNYEGKDLVNENFEGKNLTGANFTDATVKGCRFYSTVLPNANFQDADLRGSSFYKATVTGVNFKGAVFGLTSFSDCDCSGSIFTGVNFAGGRLEYVNFRNADLRNTSGYETTTELNFRGADLRGANLFGATYLGGNKASMKLQFKGAKYDSKTVFPKGYDPVEEGAVLVESESSN